MISSPGPGLELALEFIESHIDAAARELEAVDSAMAVDFIESIPLVMAQRLATRMLPVYCAQLVMALPMIRAAEMLAGFEGHEASAVLRRLPKTARDELMANMPDRQRRRCRRMLNHAEDSVGAWMSSEVLPLPVDLDAADALQRVTDAADLGNGSLFPVVEDGLRLCGYVGIAELLRARDSTRLSRFRREFKVVSLQSKLTLPAAERHPGWRRFDQLIVVDQALQPVGVLPHVTLRNALSVLSDKPAAASAEPVIHDLARVYHGALAGLLLLFTGDKGTAESETTPRQGGNR